MPKIRKILIPAAGYGTRFLPATKAQPKEMLPVVDKPIIQYLVEEAVASGIKDIVIVTRRGSRALENHFDSNFELEYQLKKQKKFALLNKISHLSRVANFVYLRQKNHLPYGNGTPIICAKDIMGDEPFIYTFGDDMVKSKIPAIKQLMDVYQKFPQAAAIVGVQKMPHKDLDKYGIIKLKKGTSNIVESIIEKPKPHQAPSQLAVFGRFILTPAVVKTLIKIPPGKDNELWLADALNKVAKTHLVIAHQIEGKWLTTGDPLSYLKATLEFALERPLLKKELLKYLKVLTKQ